MDACNSNANYIGTDYAPHAVSYVSNSIWRAYVFNHD